MSRDRHYLLIYDISEDKLRTKVSKVVEGYGVRVQKSAFECRLTRGMKARMWKALEGVELGPDDSVGLYCLAARGKAKILGRRSEDPQSEDRHAVVL